MVIITIMRYFLIKQEQSIKAEFIQSDNFTPVTDEAGNITGWGNVAIEKSLK